MSAAFSPEVEEALRALPNDQQRAFVIAYKCGETKGNGTASYAAAGYLARNLSASVNASKLLKSAKVARVLSLLEETISSEVIDPEVDYRKQWYESMEKDLESARSDGAHGPVMTGQKLLASSERYDLEVNRTTHDVAPELREAIRGRISSARARTIERNALTQGEE